MSDTLRIGLLQCGYVHPAVAVTEGDYPEAFARLLAPFDVELVTHDVQRGPVPTDPGGYDAWLVSGSASSAYEPLPWIAPVEALLRRIVEDATPLVAICFGHQLLAQAFGGTVERAPGWGVGVHAYRFVGGPWSAGLLADGEERVVGIVASHQDQVTALPDGAEVIASTEHCPVAGFTLGPNALAIQPHPEFTPAVSRGLIGLRRERIGTHDADVGLASLDDPLDRDVVAAWIDGFWRR